MYRSFKDFNHEIFLNDLQSVNFENHDVNRAYSKFETSFIEIIDKHIPIKKRKPVAYPVPYMNQNLRNAIYKKKMYHHKFLKQKTDKNWETYRKQRNFVTKLEKTSIKTYFFERTAGGPKSSTFYPTIKPFLSNEGMKSNNSIILCENDKIVNDPKEVTEIFNNFFCECSQRYRR